MERVKLEIIVMKIVPSFLTLSKSISLFVVIVALLANSTSSQAQFTNYTEIRSGFKQIKTLFEGKDGFLYGIDEGDRYGPESGILFRIQKDGGNYTRTVIGKDKVLTEQASDGFLYGTEYNTVFKMNKDGSGLSVLWEAKSEDVSRPAGGVKEAPDGKLYGVFQNGGKRSNDRGKSGTWMSGVFSLNKDGSGFEVSPFNIIGCDWAKIIEIREDDVFGLFTSRGLSRTPFLARLSKDGSVWSPFRSVEPGVGQVVVGKDGHSYGIFSDTRGQGNVFKINRDDSGYAILHEFNGSDYSTGLPLALVEGDDGLLYVVAGSFSGIPRPCAISSLKKDGSDYTVLHRFEEKDEVVARCLLMGSDGALYGATRTTLFRLSKPGQTFAPIKPQESEPVTIGAQPQRPAIPPGTKGLGVAVRQ